MKNLPDPWEEEDVGGVHFKASLEETAKLSEIGAKFQGTRCLTRTSASETVTLS